MTQRIAVIPCQPFGTTYQSHLQVSRNPRRIYSWISWPFKMGPIGCPKTSTKNCGNTLRHNPEEHGSHLLGGGCLKTQILICLYQDYALQNRHDAETCVLLGHYAANSGFTTTLRRKPEITHAWCSEHVLPLTLAIREIKCGRFWPCRKISLLFCGYYLLLCLKRNLKHHTYGHDAVFFILF
jgi:hypothetical protein